MTYGLEQKKYIGHSKMRGDHGLAVKCKGRLEPHRKTLEFSPSPSSTARKPAAFSQSGRVNSPALAPWLVCRTRHQGTLSSLLRTAWTLSPVRAISLSSSCRHPRTASARTRLRNPTLVMFGLRRPDRQTDEPRAHYVYLFRLIVQGARKRGGVQRTFSVSQQCFSLTIIQRTLSKHCC